MLNDFIVPSDIEYFITHHDNFQLNYSQLNNGNFEFNVDFNYKSYRREFTLNVFEFNQGLNIVNTPSKKVKNTISRQSFSYPLTDITERNDLLSLKEFNQQFESELKKLGKILLKTVRKNCEKQSQLKLRELFNKIDMEYTINSVDIQVTFTR